MKEIFIKELKEYSKEFILDLINKESFNKLIEYDIIKRDEDTFKFNFVGLIIVDNYLIKCYPKYIPNEENIKSDYAQTMRVIKKYKNLNDDYSWQNDNLEDISFNLLSMMIFFIEDYFENGLYTNIENIHEINGSGEINWDRTINNVDPIIKNNRPYYGELYTKYKINDLYDYFRLLHEFIITDCSKRLEELGLIELFDLTPVELSDRSQDDFGELSFILEKLEKELNVEFNTHKQKLLKSMHSYLSGKNSFTNDNFLTIYGTTTYHIIWEVMCSHVFSNKLNKEVMFNGKRQKLKEVIKKPKWILNSGKDYDAPKTFEPDIVTFAGDTFIILDAKYYKLIFNEHRLEGQPGLSDITKQYLYELALKDFIKENFKHVKNALLFPKYDGEIENKGYVEIEILSRLSLEDIQVIMLPAGEINQHYLDNKKISIEKLKFKEKSSTYSVGVDKIVDERLKKQEKMEELMKNPELEDLPPRYLDMLL